MEYSQRIIDLVSMNVQDLHKILSIEKFDDNKLQRRDPSGKDGVGQLIHRR